MAHAITIVITTRNNPQGLRRLLDSLDQQTFPNNMYDIIVADDSSDDETAKMFHGHSTPLIPTYYFSTKGAGITAGRNMSFKNAESGTILFLNDTCIAPATLIEEHSEAHSRFPHSVIRGPLMPLSGDTICELKIPFHYPQLDFTIINASIPRLGLAVIEHLNPASNELYQDNEMYWRLNAAKFPEHFLTTTYCFQDSRYFQEHSLATIKKRAERLAGSACDHYFNKPNRETLNELGLGNKLGFFQELMLNNLGASMAAGMLGGKLKGTGYIESQLMDVVFCQTFREELRKKMRNFIK